MAQSDQPVTTAETGPTDREVIAELALLTSMEYDRVRKEKAKELGIQVKTLDDEVKAARDDDGVAVRLPFADIEPHPEPIVPAQVLDEVVEIIRRYVVMDKEQADAIALWAAMTWFVDVVEVAALAIITAPEKACGKSQLLTILGYIVARPLSAANSSTSFLFRAIEVWRPTILIDEADTFIRENDEMKGLVNAGHTRTNAFVGRTVTVGDGHEPRMFNVWGAKAFAGIALERHLPDATMSRGIVVNLRRKMPHETVSRLRHADRRIFTDVAARLARFADDYSQSVRKAQPKLPDQLSDRAQDNWEPLLAIAECAGSDWLQRATAAALKLSNTGEEAVSTSNELLSDIQQVFASKRVDKISSADLIEELCKICDAPWATYNHGKALTPPQLAKNLKGYGIKSKTVRFGHETPKGFEASQFADAFARYLAATPAVPPPRNESHKSSNGKAGDDAANPPPICNAADVAPPRNETVEASTGKSECTWPDPLPQYLDPKTGECLITADCGGVADVSPVLGGSGLERPDAGF